MNKLSSRTCLALTAIFALSISALGQTNPPLWNATTAYKIGDLVTYENNTFQCLLNETTNRPNPHELGWDVNFLYTGNFTIHVGPSEEFKTLSAAWIYIKFARIAVGSTITITLDNNYTETFSTSFSLDHPYGAQISIVGTNTGQTANFPAGVAGFVLDSGHAFGQFSGLSIIGAGNSSANPAILVEDKAVLGQVANVGILGFDVGIEAERGEFKDVSAASITKFSLAGVESIGQGAEVNFSGAITLDGGFSASFGFSASQGGSIFCAGGTQSNNSGDGYFATTNGTIYCDFTSAYTTSNSPNFAGYYATRHGNIFCSLSTTSGFMYGFCSDNVGYIGAESSIANYYSKYGYYAFSGATIDAVHSGGGSILTQSSGQILT